MTRRRRWASAASLYELRRMFLATLWSSSRSSAWPCSSWGCCRSSIGFTCSSLGFAVACEPSLNCFSGHVGFYFSILGYRAEPPVCNFYYLNWTSPRNLFYMLSLPIALKSLWTPGSLPGSQIFLKLWTTKRFLNWHWISLFLAILDDLIFTFYDLCHICTHTLPFKVCTMTHLKSNLDTSECALPTFL